MGAAGYREWGHGIFVCGGTGGAVEFDITSAVATPVEVSVTYLPQHLPLDGTALLTETPDSCSMQVDLLSTEPLGVDTELLGKQQAQQTFLPSTGPIQLVDTSGKELADFSKHKAEWKLKEMMFVEGINRLRLKADKQCPHLMGISILSPRSADLALLEPESSIFRWAFNPDNATRQGPNFRGFRVANTAPGAEPEPGMLDSYRAFSNAAVHREAGRTFQLVGQLQAGEEFVALETKTVGGEVWVRFDRGWVSVAEGGNRPSVVWIMDSANGALTDNPWGRDAVGITMSSAIDDQWENADKGDGLGPGQLMQGKKWTSRHAQQTNQWIIFDLGQSSSLDAVEITNPDSQTAKNVHNATLEMEVSSDTWTVVTTMDNPESGGARTYEFPPTKAAQRWRLKFVDNWGAPDYMHIQQVRFRTAKGATESVGYTDRGEGVFVYDGRGAFIEYDITSTEAASMRVSVTYLPTKDPRPMQVHLNDEPLGSMLTATSASLHAKDKIVADLGEMSFKRGKNCLRLATEGYSPRLMEIAIVGVRAADLQCAEPEPYRWTYTPDDATRQGPDMRGFAQSAKEDLLKRVADAGGNIGFLNCSLTWDNSDDLDLVSRQPHARSSHSCLSVVLSVLDFLSGAYLLACSIANYRAERQSSTHKRKVVAGSWTSICKESLKANKLRISAFLRNLNPASTGSVYTDTKLTR
eukprot:COSAG06_NODE_8734_length_2083_cov_3.635585_1_plen_694_part_11